MTPRALLKRGIERGCGTQKEAARRLNYSPEMMNKILSGERNVAHENKPKLSGIHLIAGLALAQEATGYMIFDYIEGDRHPIVMLQRTLKEDTEADRQLIDIGWRIIDKNRPEDLTPEDVVALKAAAKETIDRINADINMIIEWEDRYQLGLLDYLTGKKKNSLVAETQATYNI